MYKKRNYLFSLFPSGMMLAVQWILSFLISLLLLPLYSAMTSSDWMNLANNIYYVAAEVAVLGIAVIWYDQLVLKRRRRIGLQVRRLFDWKCILYAILMAIGMQMLSTVILGVWELFSPSMLNDYSEMMEDSGLVETSLLSVVVTVILAPITEEYVLRGLTITYLKRAGASFWLVNFIQAFLFGLIHLNWVQGTYAFCLGLVLGYVALRYNSHWPGVAIHMAFNGYSVVLAFIAELLPGSIDEAATVETEMSMLDSLLVYGFYFVIGAALLAAGLALTDRGIKKKQARPFVFF